MTKEQINFIKALDPDGKDGTIQSILIREDLQAIPFETALKFLVTQLNTEKLFLSKQNIELTNKVGEL